MKQRMVVLLLILVFILTACQPITYNDERDRAQIIATVNGTPIYKGVFNDRLEAIKPYFEQTISAQKKEEVEESITRQKESVLESLIDAELKRQQLQDYGLEITENDMVEMEIMYENSLRNMMDFLRTQYTSAGLEPTAQELKEAAEKSFAQQGVTKEQFFENAKENILLKKLEKAIMEKVQKISEDDIIRFYDKLVSDQKNEYESNPSKFENAMERGELVVYIPKGYRRIKRIFLKYSDIEYQMIVELKRYDKPEALEDTIATAYKNISARIDEVEERLISGDETFDSLIETYSDDRLTGSLTDGYYVSSKTVKLDENMVRAAMSLENPGDISDVIREDLGASIVLYHMDVAPAGAIALKQVREDIIKSVTEEKSGDYLAEAFEMWKSQSTIVRHTDRL